MGMIIALYECPVDGCSWTFDPGQLPPPRVAIPVGTPLAESINAAISESARQLAAEVEDILREHMQGHDVVDFLRTIQRLRQDLAQVDSGIRPHVYRQQATALPGWPDTPR